MRRFVLLLVAVILGFATSAAGRRQVSDPETLGTRFFVGQIYPSGNVYLRSFGTDTTNGVRSWPQRLTMVGLPEDGNALSPEKMEVTLSEETVPMAYIPSREGMDDQHNACGPNPPGPLKRDVRYLSEDFYFALSDHCESNEGVAIYRAEPVSYSVRVVAFDLGIPLKDIHRVTGRRPLPDSERSDVALARAEFERSRAECTTEPAFPDESMRILEASMEDGVQVRLSLYTTPGCAGHLATIYILDLLRGDSVLRTFRLSQGQGLL